MLKITKLNNNLLKEALNNLPKNYLEGLYSKINYKESIISRYLIYKYGGFLPEINKNGIPISHKNNYWSISHKKGLVFIGTGNNPIGIDIEIMVPRGEEIFSIHKEEEYELIGGKSLENFYRLWTIKESIIKLNLSGIDLINKINLEKIRKIENKIDIINFDLEINGSFLGINFICFNGRDGDLVYSFSKY
ncbi:MAG: 4'-phosphopantetheinyl transferase superfamily protein [Candidatus Gracilibacteria bacterium]|nr:4'-phosphopantetheinyl transferase superfamily protein [Candidatus Gracilibacteria bacterium]